MAGKNVHEFTDAGFEADVLRSEQPVLVDFWAEWCMPCRMLTPTIEALAGEYAGRVKIGKVNIDQESKFAMKYQVTAIPTVLIFKGGEVAKRFVGMTGKGDLAAALDEAVGAKV